MLQVVGAGVGRTGTNSLKLALEQLLGGPCYHMLELFEHLEHVPTWTAANRGEPVDWGPVLGGYVAAVDWPAAACWRELAAANPDALVLLSMRADAETWWRSADQTIFAGMRTGGDPDPAFAEWRVMAAEMLGRLDPRWAEHDPAVAGYERHNAEVLAAVPPRRLLVWHPEDGWPPLCAALGVDVPDTPFPRVNTTADWRARADAAGAD
ncbi:MAG TPA: sulfotransferase [Mycobacteriales bacterium]|nr:sulfotransferase [Mycobacteriales bacterium]